MNAVRAKYDRKTKTYGVEVVRDADPLYAQEGFLVYDDAARAYEWVKNGRLIGTWRTEQKLAVTEFLAREIIAETTAKEEAGRREFEAKTVAFKVDGRDVTMAEARAVFEKYHHTPGTDWKRPVDVVVPYADLSLFMNAVTFYQGCEPTAAPARKGTVCDPGYRVKSAGYVC